MPCIVPGRPVADYEPSARTRAGDHHLRIAEALLLARAKASTRQNHNAVGQKANAGENIRRLQLLPGGWREQNASHQKV